MDGSLRDIICQMTHLCSLDSFEVFIVVKSSIFVVIIFDIRAEVHVKEFRRSERAAGCSASYKLSFLSNAFQLVVIVSLIISVS